MKNRYRRLQLFSLICTGVGGLLLFIFYFNLNKKLGSIDPAFLAPNIDSWRP